MPNTTWTPYITCTIPSSDTLEIETGELWSFCQPQLHVLPYTPHTKSLYTLQTTGICLTTYDFAKLSRLQHLLSISKLPSQLQHEGTSYASIGWYICTYDHHNDILCAVAPMGQAAWLMVCVWAGSLELYTLQS